MSNINIITGRGRPMTDSEFKEETLRKIQANSRLAGINPDNIRNLHYDPGTIDVVKVVGNHDGMDVWLRAKPRVSGRSRWLDIITGVIIVLIAQRLW